MFISTGAMADTPAWSANDVMNLLRNRIEKLGHAASASRSRSNWSSSWGSLYEISIVNLHALPFPSSSECSLLCVLCHGPIAMFKMEPTYSFLICYLLPPFHRVLVNEPPIEFARVQGTFCERQLSKDKRNDIVRIVWSLMELYITAWALQWRTCSSEVRRKCCTLWGRGWW